MFVRTGASGSSNSVTQVRIPICLLERELQIAFEIPKHLCGWLMFLFCKVANLFILKLVKSVTSFFAMSLMLHFVRW